MDFQKELYDNYPVEHYIIEIDGLELHQFYTPEYKIDDILYIYNKNNKTYEPKAYDYYYDEKKDSHYCVEIIEGDIIFEYIRTVKNVLKKTNVKNNKIEEGSLFLYQWASSIHILLEAQKYNSKFHDLERSRQTGKSFELGLLTCFLFVFGKLYFESENEKFWIILCSYRDTDGVDKIFEEAHFYLKDMIQLYNSIYYDKPIFTGRYNFKNKNYYAIDKVSACKTELNIIIDDEVRPYAIMLGLTTKVKQDGLSMDFGWLDEGFATPFEEFDRSIDAFRASTGANLVVSGISSTDSANMQFYVHNHDNSIKTSLIYPLAYNLMKITHSSRAEKMRGYVESKIKSLGIKSTNIQTNFFLNWETLDGKFYTKQLMEKNHNFGHLTKEKNITCKFRVAGLDLSTSYDFTVLTVVDVFEMNDETYNENTNRYEKIKRWRCELIGIETYNKKQEKLSSEKVAQDTAKFCKDYEIDMMLCDGTSMQKTYNEWILKKIKEAQINTLVVNYNFGGNKNKVELMSNLEDMLFSQRLKLGSKEDLLKDWGWKKLYEEMLYLIRENNAKKTNIQWHAPNAKGYTDDHVISLALAVYCVPYIERLQKDNKYIEIGLYKYKARLQKFNENKDKSKVKNILSWWQIPT